MIDERHPVRSSRGLTAVSVARVGIRPFEGSSKMQADEDASDAEIVAAVRAGDIQAFSVIVRRYEATVAATVVGMMGPGDDAEEVGHETMIKLYRSLDRFNGDAQLSTYLTRIAINASLDALRRRQRNIKRFFSPPADEDGLDWEGQIPSGADHARDFETRQAISYALKRLKPEYRAVAVLRLVQELRVEDVATILNVPQGTVLSRLSRAKTQLAKILKSELNYV